MDFVIIIVLLRVESQLRDLQDLHKKVSEDGDKPHFLVRPGSPTAEEQVCVCTYVYVYV